MEAGGRTPVVQRHHRVHWFSGRLHEVLDDLMGVDGAARAPGGQEAVGLAGEHEAGHPRPVREAPPAVWVAELSAAQTAEAVTELAAARARLQGLEAALLAHAEVVDADDRAGVVVDAVDALPASVDLAAALATPGQRLELPPVGHVTSRYAYVVTTGKNAAECAIGADVAARVIKLRPGESPKAVGGGQ